jgi:hypothetical protein
MHLGLQIGSSAVKGNLQTAQLSLRLSEMASRQDLRKAGGVSGPCSTQAAMAEETNVLGTRPEPEMETAILVWIE